MQLVQIIFFYKMVESRKLILLIVIFSSLRGFPPSPKNYFHYSQKISKISLFFAPEKLNTVDKLHFDVTLMFITGNLTLSIISLMICSIYTFCVYIYCMVHITYTHISTVHIIEGLRTTYYIPILHKFTGWAKSWDYPGFQIWNFKMTWELMGCDKHDYW